MASGRTAGRAFFSANGRRLMVGLTWALMGLAPVNALELHYSDDREPQLLRCDAMANRGDQDQAAQCFRDLLDSESEQLPSGLKAASAHAVGEVKLANRLYREAIDNDDALKNTTRWGDLYLQTHQAGEASALYREALQLDAEYLPAQLGLATAQARQYEARAREIVTDILLRHPTSVHAHILLARMELELQRVDEARLLLVRAEALATEQQLPLLEIFALQASADLLDGITQSLWTERALTLNPGYGGIYEIPAHFYIITYRYREAVELYRKATEIEPQLADAQSNLGINLLRTNDIFGARYHLEKAYEQDPYNTETVNTLRLLDDLDDMRVSYADVFAEKNLDSTETVTDEPIGRILLRLDRDEVDALEPYVIELSSRAVREFTQRYEFTLAKPVVVELYHDHDDFGVRTVSTPGVGLLGVTFGYVLAMDSPKARSTQDFHWGSTLWHELAHVFTLEAANHLLPRWFSEGISVYEEWNTGPLPSRELPLLVMQMFQNSRFLPVEDLDRGFVRPSYEGQVSVSYMQAGLICDFISKRWGHKALVTMLKAFATGASTGAALKSATSLDGQEFDLLFATHFRARYASILGNLDNWQRLGQVISATMARTSDASTANATASWQQVRDMATQRIDYYPEYIGEDNAYLSLAQAYDALAEPSASVDVRWEWFSRGGSQPFVLSTLAKDLANAGREQEAFEVLEALNWVMPYFVDEHRRLGEHYLAAGDAERAIREFNALLGVQPEDPGVALLGRARAHYMKNDVGAAKSSVLMALEQAPFYRDAQKLLLKLTSGE